MKYLNSREDADEIVKDTFLTIWEKRDELEITDQLKPLLYTIIRNKSINHIRKKRPDFVEMDEPFDFASQDQKPHEKMEARETEEIVHRLIDELPPRCRQIFILSRREFLSNKEIAAIMELSEKTIENQITIAIRAIKSGLHKSQQSKHISMVFLPWVMGAILESFT